MGDIRNPNVTFKLSSAGLDPKILSDIINIASGRCWSSDTYNPCPGVMEGVPSSNNYDGGFRAALMDKVTSPLPLHHQGMTFLFIYAQDLSIAMELSGHTKSLTPIGSLAAQLFRLMCEQGHSDKDFSYIFQLLSKSK